MAISDLADEAESDNCVPIGVCQVCYALNTIPPSEAEGLTRLLANPTVQYRKLARDLAKDKDTPLSLHYDALSRHARGFCGADPVR